MEKYVHIALLSLFLSMIGSIVVEANTRQRDYSTAKKYAWRSTPNPRTGLYGVKHGSTAQGISFSLNALYFYGDIEQRNVVQMQGDNMGVNAGLAYHYAFNNWWFLRASALGGMVQGRAENDRAFRTGFGELALGVEWYPWSNYGFYIYAGIAANFNSTHYKNYPLVEQGKEGHTAVHVVPMIPVEIGYNFNLSRGCYLAITASAHPALIDTSRSNMDGYPYPGAVYKNNSDWTDGYFSLGLTFTYRWQENGVGRILE